MNLVVICIDTLRYDYLACNRAQAVAGGVPVQTPNFDAFAAEAVVFDNAYAGSFPTIPHRTDVLTGQFGRPFHEWLPLGFDPGTLPAVLGDADYATYLVFDTPHLVNGAHGFDYPFHGWHFVRGNEVDQHIIDDSSQEPLGPCAAHYRPEVRRSYYSQYVRNNRGRNLEHEWPAPRVFEAAGDFVEMNRCRERYFLWVDCYDPHEPFDPPDHYVALYDDPDFDRDCPMMGWERLDLISPAELHHMRAHYAGEVSMVDCHLGRFLDRLAASGRDRDTAVIVISDHGTYLGSHGRLGKGVPLYEEVAHQVLMARVPGVAPGRRTQIVQPADLMATVLDLAGLPTPDGAERTSFAPVIGGQRHGGREVAVTSLAIDVATAEDAAVTVQDQRWCLISRPDRARWELYDKQIDRAAEFNMIGERPDEANRLQRELLTFLARHESHPALIQWFSCGQKGDTSDYVHRPAYLRDFRPYFALGLDVERHR